MVMFSRFVPDRGDVVWLNFHPSHGHEQAGRRPAIVLSPADYNARAGLAIVCPVTGRVKHYPFEVAIPEGEGIRGAVLSDQIRSVDWKVRKAKLICRLSMPVTWQVLNKLNTLLFAQLR